MKDCQKFPVLMHEDATAENIVNYIIQDYSLTSNSSVAANHECHLPLPIVLNPNCHELITISLGRVKV